MPCKYQKHTKKELKYFEKQLNIIQNSITIKTQNSSHINKCKLFSYVMRKILEFVHKSKFSTVLYIKTF